MKKFIAAMISIALACAFLSGCGAKPEAPAELWVITEETTEDGMNYVAEKLAERFAEENPGSSIRLDILPTEEAAREACLDSLRVKIAAGDGPDVYLLPSAARLTTETPKKYSYYVLDSLFPDVQTTMGNRQFADLSTYYDQDTELNRDGLLGTVMDAGTLDGKRYILPLRFNMMTYFLLPELLEKTAVSQELFEQDLGTCLSAVSASEDPDLMAGFFYSRPEYFFSDVIDYGASEVRIDREALLRYAREEKRMSEKLGTLDPRCRISVYAKHNYTPRPASIQPLANCLDAMAISSVENMDACFLPLRSMEGTVSASVTYYAAVDGSCATPELAYRFIRLFLTEDAQWEGLRRQPAGTQYPTLLEDSWPVRTKGSTAALWESYKEQVSSPPLKQVELADDTVLDSLTSQIQTVSFQTDAMQQLSGVVFAENLEESVDAWLQDLRYGLMEG